MKKDIVLKEFKERETTFVVSDARLGPSSEGTVEGFFHRPWMVGEAQIYLSKNPLTGRWSLWGVSIEEVEIYCSASGVDIPWLSNMAAEGIKKAYRDLVALGYKIADKIS